MMKPPNITPPPVTQPVDQLGSTTATAPKQQQLHPQAPINATMIPSQQQQQQQQQQMQHLQSISIDSTTSSTAAPTTATSTLTLTPTTSNNTSAHMNAATAIVAPQPTIIKPTSQTVSITTSPPTPASVMPPTSMPMTINVVQEQQAPLALTTQHQNRAQIQINPTTTTNQVQIQQLPAYQQQTMTSQIVSITSSPAPSTTQTNLNPQLSQLPQAKIQPTHLQNNSTISPITLTTASSATGPTALVIIPQHSGGAPIASSKGGSITTKSSQIPTTLTTQTAHIALAAPSQASTIQMQTPVSGVVPNMAQVPITAHQNTTLVNRPPQTLPVVPITTASTITVKNEVNRHTCCLFDNGIRCDRVAGNASFSARIQKIVGTKKMNFALDQSARHSYICDHHKAIITVAKKSTALARDTKANARNFVANNNANTPHLSQHANNFNDLAMGQSPLQHQMNLEMLSNQSRLANNHAAVMNSIPMRPGTQIAYYTDPHTNQMVPMDTINVKFANTGGDSVPSSSGGIDVDLQQLQVNTLRRYKRHFRVQTRPGLNKLQLAESLKHHFRTLPIIEKEAITYFVYIVKCHRNKLDHDKTKPE